MRAGCTHGRAVRRVFTGPKGPAREMTLECK